jgi:arylsulfatase A-like enzyme
MSLKMASGFTFLMAFVGCSALPAKEAQWDPPTKPNIVFILLDDVGWMDSTTYGSRYYETPNMDRLAAEGMRFTDAYAAAPICSPTRASILVGQWPARLRMTTPSGHMPTRTEEPTLQPRARPDQKVLIAQSRTQLPLEEFTIAEALKEAGYATGFIGKWHLGREDYWPDKQGFDVNVGGAHHPGPPSYFSPYRIVNLPDGPSGEYITDRLTDEAIKFMDEHREGPFFLCLWHFAVHSPWEPKPEVVEKYRDKVDPRGEQHNPEMAALIESTDESLGRILDHLESTGLASGTLVVLFSDNGGLVRVPGGPEVIRCNGRYRGGDHITSNRPLRGGKGTIYEGGTREPLIIRWPGVVKPGSLCHEVVTSVDFYPTLLEITGLKPNPDQVLDGSSFVPLLVGNRPASREAIFCHFPHYSRVGNHAPATSVRKGDWKLIRFYGEGPTTSQNAFELYNLREDMGESRNLSRDHPEKVREMDAMIDEFLKDSGALVPIPNPVYQEPPQPSSEAADSQG